MRPVVARRSVVVDADSSGVSLALTRDADSKRLYLAMAESSSHSVRLMDVTDTPNGTIEAKVTSIVQTISPLEIIDARRNELLVFDPKGVLSAIDVGPVLRCSNVFNITDAAMDDWMPTGLKDGASKATVIVSRHVTNLKRASEATTSAGHPWQLLMQKKVQRPLEGSGIILTKKMFCSKPQGSPQYDCCVKKAMDCEALMSSAEGADTRTDCFASLPKAKLSQLRTVFMSF